MSAWPSCTAFTAAAELGAGVFLDPVDPLAAAAQLRFPDQDSTASHAPGAGQRPRAGRKR